MSDVIETRAAAREAKLRKARSAALDDTRTGFPEPTLLPHLVGALALPDLPVLFELLTEMERSDNGFSAWPRLLDATCASAARRLPAASEALLEQALGTAPATLFSHLDLSLVHDAQRALLPDGASYGGPARAERLCRLAACHQGHAGGVLTDLASAALLDLTPEQALAASGWFVRIASDSERQHAVAAWCASDWPDAAAAVAMFDAATHAEHDALAAALATWLHDGPGTAAAKLAVAASVVPLMHGEQQTRTLHWLGRALDRAELSVPPWWRALVMSRLGACDVPIRVSSSVIPSLWYELGATFAPLSPDSGYADVMRAHPGAGAWLAADGYPGVDARRARDIVARIARYGIDARSGGAAAPPSADASDAGPIASAPAESVPPRPPRPNVVVQPSPGAGPATAPAPTRGVGGAIGSALGGLLGGVIEGSSSAVDAVLGAIFRRRRSGTQPGTESDDVAMRGGADSTRWSMTRERELQADVRLAGAGADAGGGALLDAFRPGQEHRVAISIGRGASVHAGVAFVQPVYAQDRDAATLDLRLIHGDQVVGGRIDLPRDERDNSDVWPAALVVAADAQRVEAIVVVLHKGRVLQAAQLTGPVLAPGVPRLEEQRIELRVIADVHQFAYLETRAAFDASVVSSETSSAAFAGDSYRVQDLRGVTATVNKIMDRLFRSTEAIAMAGDAEDARRQQALLVYLAAQGKALHGALIKPRLGALNGAARIQIVNVGQAPILPLELIYDGPSPTHDATLCPGWREALQSGVCPSCTLVAPGTRVATICPLGFWALAKVIERHAPGEPRADGYDYRLDTCVPGQRDQLRPLQHALFAASENVPEDRVEETLAVLRRLEPDCDEARSWADWLGVVQSKAPALLVSMPHNALDPVLDIPTLEIGRGSDLRAGEVSRQHVCAEGAEPGPLVLLLGCQTAQGGPLPYHSFVSEFRGNGAAIVIGTLATVLGEHAAPIVQVILSELGKPTDPAERTFGDVLLRMRRQMFARGILIALAVAAFGDADWSLPPSGEPS